MSSAVEFQTFLKKKYFEQFLPSPVIPAGQFPHTKLSSPRLKHVTLGKQGKEEQGLLSTIGWTDVGASISETPPTGQQSFPVPVVPSGHLPQK